MTSCIAQFTFLFYRPKPIRVDFSGGQISSDAGLLPLRAFDQRHGLTRDLAQRLSDPRADERVRHSTLALLRQRSTRSWLATRTLTMPSSPSALFPVSVTVPRAGKRALGLLKGRTHRHRHQ